jgi:hypothetical protein
MDPSAAEPACEERLTLPSGHCQSRQEQFLDPNYVPRAAPRHRVAKANIEGTSEPHRQNQLGFGLPPLEDRWPGRHLSYQHPSRTKVATQPPAAPNLRINHATIFTRHQVCPLASQYICCSARRHTKSCAECTEIGVLNLSGCKSAFTKACPNLYMPAESSARA